MGKMIKNDDNENYAMVFGWIGWDTDGNLRIAEDSEWDSEDDRGFAWDGEPKSICLKMPLSAHPSLQTPKKKTSQVIYVDFLSR
jgi:hypothetical protein